MQDSLLKASAKEILRTDLLHVSAKQLHTHIEYPIGSYVLVHYRSGSPLSRLHTSWRGPMGVVAGVALRGGSKQKDVEANGG